MSSPSSPISTSSTLTEERSTRTMADVVKDLDTDELIEYLRKKNLKLKEEHFEIFRQEGISGLAFLEMTKVDFRECGFGIGTAIAFAKFIEDLGQKLRSYSSYKTLDDLKEMLRKNKVNGEDITNIKQFVPVFEEIDDNDKAFNHCMDDIILKLSNVETMTDANEATRCEFISAILHASIDITKKYTTEDIFIALQKDISGEESTGRVDYAIKSVEELLCITEGKPRNIKIGYAQNLAQLESAYQTNKKKKRTADEAFGDEYFDYLYGIVSTAMEWHFIIYTSDGIYCTSSSECQINLSKTAIKENLDTLRSSVKRVIGIIVGLLKDRVSVDNSPASKKARIEKITKK